VTEDPPHDPKAQLVGLAITVLLVGGVGGWAATAIVRRGIAPGTIVVDRA
jgi:tRNA A37 threonylcarbamoyladenosine dehydratase